MSAWPAPATDFQEASLARRPIDFLYDKSVAPSDWKCLLWDERWRCFSFYLPKAFPSKLSARFLKELKESGPWLDIRNKAGTRISRRTCWYVRDNCTCHYTYGDIRVSGTSSPKVTGLGGNSERFTQVMDKITEHVFERLFPHLATEDWPNSANCNWYEEPYHGVGWHADDERLFGGLEHDCPIISLSLGGSREFWFGLRESQLADKPLKSTIIEHDLHDGDIATMEGMFQKHIVHFVPITRPGPYSPKVSSRINITWRWILNHRQSCRNKGSNSLNPGLRGFYGQKGSSNPPRSLGVLPPFASFWSYGLGQEEWNDGEPPKCPTAEMVWGQCNQCSDTPYEEGRNLVMMRISGCYYCRRCWASFRSFCYLSALPPPPLKSQRCPGPIKTPIKASRKNSANKGVIGLSDARLLTERNNGGAFSLHLPTMSLFSNGNVSTSNSNNGFSCLDGIAWEKAEKGFSGLDCYSPTDRLIVDVFNGAIAESATEEDASGCMEPASDEHLLHCKWSLWVLMHRLGEKGRWGNKQHKVHDFDTVESFWRMVNHILPPSMLETADYSIFRSDLSPMWEDQICRKGGRWVAKLEKLEPQQLEEVWRDLCLCLIGETWNASACVGPEVCGLVVAQRTRSCKIAIWLGTRDDEVVTSMGDCVWRMLAPRSQLISELFFEDFRQKRVTITLVP